MDCSSLQARGGTGLPPTGAGSRGYPGMHDGALGHVLGTQGRQSDHGSGTRVVIRVTSEPVKCRL